MGLQKVEVCATSEYIIQRLTKFVNLFGGKIMRTFVYLDTGILNSYISQINGGLIARKQLESMESLKEGKDRKSTRLNSSHS